MKVLTEAQDFFRHYPFILDIILPIIVASLAFYLIMKFVKSQVRKGEFQDNFGIKTPRTEAERRKAQETVNRVIAKKTFDVNTLSHRPGSEKKAKEETEKLRRIRHSAIMQHLDVDGSLKRHLTKDR